MIVTQNYQVISHFLDERLTSKIILTFLFSFLGAKETQLLDIIFLTLVGIINLSRSFFIQILSVVGGI